MIITKAIVLSMVGATTLLGSTSPLMHIGATKDNWINKWHIQTHELLEPILKDCKVNEDETRYTVFMETSAEAGGASGPKISFRVEKTTGPWNEGRDKKVVWRGGAKVGDQGIDEWKFDYKNDTTLDFMYPGNYWGMSRNMNTICKERKIQPVKSSDRRNFGPGEPLSVKEVTLSLSTSDCQHNFSNVICGITINSSNKLQWIKGKEPKITYTAFK